MDKIKVTVCAGTACFVMGASDLMLIKERLPPEVADDVEISGCPCIEECKGSKNGRPPYVRIDGETIHSANIADVVARICEIRAERRTEAARAQS